MDFRRGVSRALTPGTLSLSFDDYRTSDWESMAEEIDGTDDEQSLSGRPSLAATLPTEVILQILYFTDPETFLSLVLVNRTWRKAAEHYQVYAFQLERCPSYTSSRDASIEPYKEEDLPDLKRQLGQEAKRNLFAAFLRPQQTILNIVSTTTSSSAAFPYGEGYEFSFSYRAQYCLAISSSRIVVLNTALPAPSVIRELKVVRRPLAACILADGSLLAVLAANHRVNLYDLTREHVMFKRSLELDETAHTITMTIGGEILAAGCEGGVEVVSLAERGPQTPKRVIKCDRVDHLAFSTDGTMLLGTTQAARNPSTVILTAPYFTDFSEHEMEPAELLSHLWTSQIIFPNNSRDCSHAALLPRSQDHESNWTLAYDRVFESFRAVRTDDLRNGTTYFTGPDPDPASPQQLEFEQLQREQARTRRSKSTFTPRTLPAIASEGELVAAAFLTSDIWLYGVPEDLEHSGVRYRAPRIGFQTPSPRNSLREVDRLPRWQLLVDKYRNVFAKGRKVASVTGASNLSWCSSDGQGTGHRKGYDRLVVAAPGGVSDSSDLPNADLASVDGGRLVFLDFHLGSVGGETEELTIEVGIADPELLEEENMNMEEEIAVVRRRTLARQEGVSRLTVASVADVLRPATIAGAPPIPPLPGAVGFGLDDTKDEAPPHEQVSSEETTNVNLEGLEGPYSQSGPRSRETVYRSAAAVEANRRRNPPTRQNQSSEEFRRTDGSELPHESDADNWVPPPPAYGEHVGDDKPPQDMRRSAASRSGPDRSQTADQTLSTEPTESGQQPTTRGNRQSAASQLSPINIRNSVVSQLTPSSSPDTRRSLLTQPSPNAPLVSPMSIPSPRLLRRTVGSNDRLQPGGASRRRSTADIEGTRWFSRHEDNRSTSPALTDEEPLQRSQSQRNSPTTMSPPISRRPASSYTPRLAVYRAALQPPPAIDTIPEPESSRDPMPQVRISQASDSLPKPLTAPNLQSHLDSPSPSPPGPEQLAAVLGRERSVSPILQEADRSTTARQRDQQPPRSVPSAPSSRPAPEPSAWASNTMYMAAVPRPVVTPPPLEPQLQPSRKSQRILGIGRFGASPEPQQLSTAIDAGPMSPSAHRVSTYTNRSGESSRPNDRSFARRSLRFMRRPKTEDPAMLAAAAPVVPSPRLSNTITARDMVASVNAAAAPTSRAMARSHAHTQSLVDPPTMTAPHRHGWERTPNGELPISPLYEQSMHIQSPNAPGGQRRVRMFSRIPPGAVHEPLARGPPVGEGIGSKRRKRERKCVVM